MYVVSRDENEVDNQGENFSCNKFYVLTFYFVQIHSKKVMLLNCVWKEYISYKTDHTKLIINEIDKLSYGTFHNR